VDVIFFNSDVKTRKLRFIQDSFLSLGPYIQMIHSWPSALETFLRSTFAFSFLLLLPSLF
jgi:hypothetical protein